MRVQQMCGKRVVFFVEAGGGEGMGLDGDVLAVLAGPDGGVYYRPAFVCFHTN